MHTQSSNFEDPSSLPKRHRNVKKVLTYVVCLSAFIVLASFMRASATQAQETSAYSRPVRTIHTQELNFAAPLGLAFLPGAETLVTVNRSQSASVESAVSKLALVTLREEAAGTVNVPAIANPDNMTFDGRFNRLLAYDIAHQELVAIAVNAAGQVDSASVTRYSLSGYGLKSPRGLAVDPSSGTLFILDAAAARIYRLEPAADGSFGGNTSARLRFIDLQNTGIVAPRALAFNSSNGHLYVWAPSRESLYELDMDGRVIATRDLSELDLRDLNGLVFAPSGDVTDDPALLSLYAADSGLSAGAKQGGRIVEITFIEPIDITQIQRAATVSLVKLTQTSQWSPASPDPSGIAYRPSTNSLIVSDGEVDEMTIYQGVNVYQATLSGNLMNGANTLAFSKEPTGAAVNTNNNHLFFTDDDKKKVFEVNLGADGNLGTADDVVTSFSTSAFGSGDPEGISFDSAHNTMYIADGVNKEIYIVTPGANGRFDGIAPAGDDQVTNFDTNGLGQTDPEAVEYNTDKGTLYIVGNRATKIIETTTSGVLINVMDIAFLNAVSPAGLAYAPGSTDPAVRNLYMIARGIDNDSNPTENDGKMYELTGLPGGSTAPTPTATNTATATPSGNVRTFAPTADARVEQANPATNYGTKVTINVDLSTDIEGYLRFAVSNVSGTVQSAKLRLFATTDTKNGPTLQTTDNSWTETTINWNNHPSATSGVIDNLAVIPPAAWVEYDVTSVVSGNGTYNFLLKAETTDGVAFSSREGTMPPQLVLTLGTVTPGPSATPTNTATATNTPAPTNTPTPTNTPGPTNTPAPTYTPSPTTPASGQGLILSLASSGAAGNLSSVYDEDIVSFNGTSWTILFDGSDVGAGPFDVDAFYIVDANTILMSFEKDGTLGALTVDDADILQFKATSLGTNTAGTFSLYFDGSDVGLDTSAEDIDGIEVLADGRILLSTTGSLAVPGTSGNDEDIFVFTPTSLGDNTSGTWAMYFDGSDVALNTTSGEDINGFALDNSGNLYLTTLDVFSVANVSGQNEDVFVCAPTSLGSNTACNFATALYFVGSTWGLSANNIDAIDLP